MAPVDLAPLLEIRMEVDLGRLDRYVSKVLLHESEISVPAVELAREAVPDRVGRHAFGGHRMWKRRWTARGEQLSVISHDL